MWATLNTEVIVGFSCEDSKVSVDEVQESIEAMEDMVQSVEIASFTKIWANQASKNFFVNKFHV